MLIQSSALDMFVVYLLFVVFEWQVSLSRWFMILGRCHLDVDIDHCTYNSETQRSKKVGCLAHDHSRMWLSICLTMDYQQA